MSKEYPVSVSDVRSKYATVFKCVAELHNLVYREELDVKFEIVSKATKRLYEDKHISEYIFESLKNLYDLYPELLPGRVVKAFEEDEDKEQNKLEEIDKLLSIMINDLNAEIADMAQIIAERMRLDYADDEDK